MDEEQKAQTICEPSPAVQITKEITDSIVGLIGFFLIGYFLQQILNLLGRALSAYINRNSNGESKKTKK